MKALTMGAEALDRFIGEGFAPGVRFMCLGPPFHGKDVFMRQLVLANLQRGVPAVIVLADRSSDETKAILRAMDPAFDAYDAKGMVRWVDAFPAPAGRAKQDARARRVEGPHEIGAIAAAVHELQDGLPDPHLLILDSVSTLLQYHGVRPTYRFLQSLMGGARAAGATVGLILDQGVMPPPGETLFEPLVDGVLQFVTEGDHRCLRPRGFGLGGAPYSMDCTFNRESFEVTTTLAEGRIR